MPYSALLVSRYRVKSKLRFTLKKLIQFYAAYDNNVTMSKV